MTSHLNRKHTQRHTYGNLLFLVGSVLFGAALQWLYTPVEMVSPLGEVVVVAEAREAQPSPIAVEPIVTHEDKYEVDDMSVYISEAVQEFLPKYKSESLMIMHCLAHRENGHAANRNCGDSGKACGPFQFHQPTWESYRKIMIKAGLATEIGDRYDKKESARTTAWAISTGRAYAWGPILRYSEGSNYAACQSPSWYTKGEK